MLKLQFIHSFNGDGQKLQISLPTVTSAERQRDGADVCSHAGLTAYSSPPQLARRTLTLLLLRTLGPQFSAVQASQNMDPSCEMLASLRYGLQVLDAVSE